MRKWLLLLLTSCTTPNLQVPDLPSNLMSCDHQIITVRTNKDLVLRILNDEYELQQCSDKNSTIIKFYDNLKGTK